MGVGRNPSQLLSSPYLLDNTTYCNIRYSYPNVRSPTPRQVKKRGTACPLNTCELGIQCNAKRIPFQASPRGLAAKARNNCRFPQGAALETASVDLGESYG